MHNNKYIIFFTISMCLIISLLLSTASAALKDKQDLNRKIDMHKNILSAAGINIIDKNEIEIVYNKCVKELYINSKGKILNNQSEKDIKKMLIYSIKDQKTNENIISYVYPIKGKGLWSTLLGYLAVDKTGKTIVGITFYKQGETPGLGAEIEKKWFRDNFIGKKLYKDNKFVGLTVAKNKAIDHPNYRSIKDHIVDGISGATITAKGVEKMLKKEPIKYSVFFKINK